MASYEEAQAAIRDNITHLASEIPRCTSSGAARDIGEAVEHLANAANALKSAYNVAPDRG
jgi:hypothetical protein